MTCTDPNNTTYKRIESWLNSMINHLDKKLKEYKKMLSKTHLKFKELKELKIRNKKNQNVKEFMTKFA